MKQMKLAVVVVAVVVVVVSAMYEDEVRLTTWHQKQVGLVERAKFSPKGIAVQTQQNALALINSKNGSLVWRHTFSDEDHIDTFVQHSNTNALLSVSGSCRNLIMWSLTGDVLWERGIASVPSSPCDAIFSSDGFNDYFVILSSNNVQLYEWQSGTLLHDLQSSSTDTKAVLFADPGTTSFSVLQDGLISVSFKIESNQMISISPQKQPQIPNSVGVRSPITPINENMVLVATAHSYPHQTVITVTDITSGRPKAEFSSNLVSGSKNGDVELVFVHTFKSKSSKSEDAYVVRILLVTSDHCLTLLSGMWSSEPSTPGVPSSCDLTWQREEALANVVATEWVSLPPEDVSHLHHLLVEFGSESATPISFGNNVVQVFSRFIIRVREEAADILQSLNSFLKPPSEDLLSTKIESSLSHSDSFGYNKVIVMATNPGVLVGIHSVTGQQLWRLYRPLPVNIITQKLFVLRPSASMEPMCALLQVSTQASNILYFNPITGEMFENENFGFAAVQAFQLPGSFSKTETHPLVLLESTDDIIQAHLTPFLSASEPEHDSPLYTYVIDKIKGELRGFACDVESLLVYSRSSCTPTWRVQLSNGENIETIATPHHLEVIQSPARVLGDRSLMVKYSTVNTFAIATKTTAFSEQHNSPITTIHVYLFDSVTGQVLFSTFYRKAKGPVYLVLSENSLLVHFWGISQFKVSIVELYDKDIDWSNSTHSSYQRVLPDALEQTYNFPTGVSAVAVSVSRHVALQTGQIISLPKQLFDPRRPILSSSAPLTNEQKEEGLIPYDSHIPLPPREILSYTLEVLGVTHFSVAPTLLESTCHVLAFGGFDLFYARVAPSGTFDMLTSDFDYYTLSLTVVFVFAATAFTGYMSKRKQLHQSLK